MNIKKGKLNYDQSGRAYPDNPRIEENWDCIWEYEGKYYKLVGDDEHKEWDEVNVYNIIVDEVYENYTQTKIIKTDSGETHISPLGHYNGMTKEQFINKCKTNPEFSEKWGLKIEEREILKQIDQTNPMLKGSTTLVPTKLITLTYKDTIIESYE